MKLIDRQVVAGFSGMGAVTRLARPKTDEELARLFAAAADRGERIALRGSGCSYGDAAQKSGGMTIDLTRLDAILALEIGNPGAEATVDVQPGVTVRQLIERVLPLGYFPEVVPGTGAPTLGGCLAMDVHGKNSFRVPSIGEQVRELEVLTVGGERRVLTPGRDDALLRGFIGSMGLLGAMTRLRLRLRKVESGRLRVEVAPGRNLEELFDLFEAGIESADNVVAWVDGVVQGRSLGRGAVERGFELSRGEDRLNDGAAHQDVGRGWIESLRAEGWRGLSLLLNPLGIGPLFEARFRMAQVRAARPRLIPRALFHFVLDGLPGWERAYGHRGFVQIQPFVPEREARAVFRRLLLIAHARGLPPYLTVLKRHRASPSLLGPLLDGWSLAMDFPVPKDAPRLRGLADAIADEVLTAGGRFYFAKDSLLTAEQARRSVGAERLAAFGRLKRELDPAGILETDLAHRLFPDGFGAA